MKIKLTLVFALIGITFLWANNRLKKVAPLRTNSVMSERINLKDGETVMVDSLLTKAYNHSNLVDNLSPFLSSPTLTKFDTDSNQVVDLVTYVNSIGGYRNLGYWSISPSQNWETSDDANTINSPTYSFYVPNDDSYDWTKIDGFTTYYHILFRDKAARTILFDQALESVLILCKNNPDDFRQRILKELDVLLKFTNSLNEKKVFTDEGIDKLKNYWMGFIYRRFKEDKVPLTEIKTCIIKAQTKLKEMSTYLQADSYYSYDLNGQISLLYSTQGFKLVNSTNFNEVKYELDKKVEYIKYMKSSNGDTYEVNGTSKAGGFTEVYDKNLKKMR